MRLHVLELGGVDLRRTPIGSLAQSATGESLRPRRLYPSEARIFVFASGAIHLPRAPEDVPVVVWQLVARKPMVAQDHLPYGPRTGRERSARALSPTAAQFCGAVTCRIFELCIVFELL